MDRTSAELSARLPEMPRGSGEGMEKKITGALEDKARKVISAGDSVPLGAGLTHSRILSTQWQLIDCLRCFSLSVTHADMS